MSDAPLSIYLANDAATQALGAALAQLLRVGDIVCLSGDLGAGKTTFSRGLISALTKAREVPSPTYTLLQTYSAPEFEIWHFDLYRIKAPHEMWELGIEDAFYDGVSLIEWPECMEHLWPDGTLNLEIKFDGKGRRAEFAVPEIWQPRLKDFTP